MHKYLWISFAAGSAVAIVLAILWRLADTGYIRLTYSEWSRFGDYTFFICPSSFLLMEVDPVAPISFGIATLYLAAIVLNGLLYAGIAAILRKLIILIIR